MEKERRKTKEPTKMQVQPQPERKKILKEGKERCEQFYKLSVGLEDAGSDERKLDKLDFVVLKMKCSIVV